MHARAAGLPPAAAALEMLGMASHPSAGGREGGSPSSSEDPECGREGSSPSSSEDLECGPDTESDEEAPARSSSEEDNGPRAACCSGQLPGLAEEGSRERSLRPPCTLGNVRMVLVTLALGALTLWAGHTVISAPPPGTPEEGPVQAWQPPPELAPTRFTARMLLESSELADVATEQLMAAGHETLTPGDRHMVRAVARAGFGNISLMLQSRVPATARRLSSFQLTEDQKLSVLGVVRHMADPRVQKVGRELTRALRDFLDTSSGDNRADMELHIRRALQPRLGELRQLRDEVLAAPLRRAGGASGDSDLGGRWGVAINPDRMRVVKTFDNKWKFEFDMSRPQRSTKVLPRRRLSEGGEDSKPYGVAGGVVEQARVLLDQLQAVLGQFGIETEVPGWVTSLDGTSKPFLSDLLQCVKDSIGDTALMIMCPMKFASAGIDVFSSLSEQAPTPAAPTGPVGRSPIAGSPMGDNVLWRDW